MNVDEGDVVLARLNRALAVAKELNKLGLHHLARLKVFDARTYAAEWQVRQEEAKCPVNMSELERRRAKLSAMYKMVDDYKREHGSE